MTGPTVINQIVGKSPIGADALPPRPAIVAHAMLRFDALRSEALPRAASRDLIMKVAEDRWT